MAGMELRPRRPDKGCPEHRWRVALLCLALTAGAHRAACATPERSCAAFGPTGDWAAAMADSGTLAFEMHAQKVPAKTLDMHLQGTPNWCQIFLSADGRHVAVGVYIAVGNEDVPQIGVFDRSAGTWSSNFIVKQRRLDGFLGDTSKLVVTARGEPKPREDMNVEVLLFGPDGKSAAGDTSVRTVPRVNRLWSTDPVDATHNRLWFMNGPQFCPINSIALVGGTDYGPTIDGTAVGGDCFAEVIGFPSADVVVGGKTGNQDLVWRADLASGSGEKIELAMAKHGPLNQWVAGSMSPTVEISPDGGAFVISRSFTQWDILDRSRDGDGELDVIQSKPLQLLGIIPLRRTCEFGGRAAIDHRNGSVVVLQRRCGKWERNEFPTAAR
jgi:hypothetical protein